MAKTKAKNDKEITPESFEKGRRVKRAIAYLTYRGIIDDQKDLVPLLRTHVSTISNAVSGKGRYPDGIIKKLVDKFDYFNRNYLMEGEGDLVLTELPESAPEYYMSKYIESLESIIKYKSGIDSLKDKNQSLENEIAELKKLLNLPEGENGSAEAV